MNLYSMQTKFVHTTPSKWLTLINQRKLFSSILILWLNSNLFQRKQFGSRKFLIKTQMYLFWFKLCPSTLISSKYCCKRRSKFLKQQLGQLSDLVLPGVCITKCYLLKPSKSNNCPALESSPACWKAFRRAGRWCDEYNCSGTYSFFVDSLRLLKQLV